MNKNTKYTNFELFGEEKTPKAHRDALDASLSYHLVESLEAIPEAEETERVSGNAFNSRTVRRSVGRTVLADGAVAVGISRTVINSNSSSPDGRSDSSSMSFYLLPGHPDRKYWEELKKEYASLLVSR